MPKSRPGSDRTLHYPFLRNSPQISSSLSCRLYVRARATFAALMQPKSADCQAQPNFNGHIKYNVHCLIDNIF